MANSENGVSKAVKLVTMAIFGCFMLMLTIHCTLVNGLNVRWCPMPCECYNQYETADCSRRALTHLPPFSNLTKRIYADNNAIQELNYAGLSNLNHLWVLSMPKNNLTEVSLMAFCGLVNVLEINLSRNKIQTFLTDINTSKSSCVLENITRLHLDYNKLRVIPQNLSAVAPNLEFLSLAYNKISSIRLDDSFSKFSSLQFLDFTGNHIHEIEANDLAPLSDLPLETLQLSECAIYRIDKTAFLSLSNLTSISFSRNLIAVSILQEAFYSLGNYSKLEHLDLSEMYLPNVTNNFLKILKKLESLDLSYSSVATIEPQLFTSLSNMEMISLEGNLLSKLVGINRAHKLKKLFLGDNKLQQINLGGLYSLETVDISGNLFVTLPQNWLSGVDTIRTLNLSHNNLKTLSHRAFQRVTLHTLDLSHNKLTMFHRYGLLKVQKLDLSHNRISRLTDNAFDNLEPVLEQLDLSYNKFKEFPLLRDRDFIALQRLNLGNNELGEALKRGHLMTLLKSLTHLQVFDLSYNQVTVIPQNQVGNLHHLTTLLLQGNRIRTLGDLGLEQMRSLAQLVISDNELETVDSVMLEEMDYLEVLDFSNNPFDCSCRILPLQAWMNSTLVMILKVDSVQYNCVTPPSLQHEHIQHVHPNPLDCLRKTKLTLKLKLQIIAIALGILLTLSILTFLVCYHGKLCSHIKTLQYKWQIRYREVSSAGAECAEQEHDLKEHLSVENMNALQLDSEYQPMTDKPHL